MFCLKCKLVYMHFALIGWEGYGDMLWQDWISIVNDAISELVSQNMISSAIWQTWILRTAVLSVIRIVVSKCDICHMTNMILGKHEY